MNRAAKIATLLVVLTVSQMGFTEVRVGTPAFGSYGGGPDIVNLANLNAHWKFSITNKAGRGVPFSYVITNDSSVWVPAGVSGSQYWTPVGSWGWRRQTDVTQGMVGYTFAGSGSCQDFDSGLRVYFNKYRFSSYTDRQGVNHSLGNIVLWDDWCEGWPGIYSSTITLEDGTRVTITADPSATVYPRAGGQIDPLLNSTSGSGTAKDSNGNKITTTGTVFTDTLNTTVLTISGTAPNPVSYTYTSPSGAAVSVVLNYSTYTVRTNFACSGIAEYGPLSQSLVSSIVLPDGSSYTFTYEPTPGFTGSFTGRLASVTLPTGGTISYTYTGGNNGIMCGDGSTAGLTRTTPDGTWTYTRSGTAPAWVTTITDPSTPANQTVLNFQDIYETQRQVYQGSVGGTLLSTVVTCYNGNLTNCTTTAVATPITRRTVTLQLPGGLQSKRDTFYNGNGLVTQVDEYVFGSGAPGALTRRTVTAYAALGNGIYDRPSSIEVQDGAGVVKGRTTFSYDQTAVTATTGTPQKDAVTGARGNVTTVSNLVQGTTTLSRTFSYFDTGNVKSSTDVNLAVTNYTYAACGNSFPTLVSMPLTLTRSMTWNCTGGVALTSTDENVKTTTSTYNDPYFWRPASVTDPLTNATSITYPNLTTTESILSFNGGLSLVDVLATRDNLGRPKLAQQRRAPGSATFDSVETNYDVLGRPYRNTLPYAGSAGQTNPSGPGTTATYDALGRATQVMDSGGGSVTFTYSQNDVLRTLGPAPIGENTKRVQNEYDALGRLTSVCEVTSATGSASCSQNTAQTGYRTAYTYNTVGNLTGVTQGSQTRTYSYDLLGRMTSEANPETGTTSYFYDTATTPCSGTYNGDLVKRVDAVGNTTCYVYDSLHRATSVTYSGPYAANTPTKKFVYDTATVNGVVMANAKARLAEAYTCTGTCTTKLTDLGFSYSARGELLTVLESTPNSAGYYSVNATYWEHGLLKTLSGLGLPTFTAGVDGKGRPLTISASSGQNPVTATSFDAANWVTGVTLGSLDSDAFQYDANTGRTTQYQFNINGQAVIGNLTWNANGSLGSLSITDPFNSANSQTCSFAHDDLGRIASVNCGAVWSQTFTYDPYGNISKTGSSSFQPTYNTASNRIQSLPGFTPTYDANGNLLSDSTHTYTWDAESRPKTIDSVTLTYDPLGRMVQQQVGSTYTQVVYSPTGEKLALMNGQTLQKAYVPLPAGASAVYTSAGLSRYRHPDWLGSNRFASTPARTMYFDSSYAPYGEAYAQTGTTDLSFTGQNQDTVTGLHDFLFREYHPVQGRWVSPDPAGIAAASIGDPQSWNRYGYVSSKPLNSIDPLGLCMGAGRSDACNPRRPWYDALHLFGEFASRLVDQYNAWLAIQGGTVTTTITFNCDGPGCDQVVTHTSNYPPVFAAEHSIAGVVFDAGTRQLLRGLLETPWSFNAIVPLAPEPGVAGVGPALTISYIPGSTTLCVGGGFGISVGKNVSFGPLVAGSGNWPSNAVDVLSGPGISAGGNLPNLLGAQGTVNSAGWAAGPSVGVPGVAVAATASACGKLVP